MTRADVWLALATCLLALALGDVLARELVVTSSPDSYQAPRNPNFRRGWVGYTGAPVPLPMAKRAIVISNSQGFLREYVDGREAYPSRLEGLLTGRERTPWEVLNWSIPGGKMPEMTLLAARAGQHRPDTVLLVTFTENFTGESLKRPLSFSISDVPLLGADSGVRAALSPAYTQRFEVGGLSALISRDTGLGALRQRTIEADNETWTWVPRMPRVDLTTGHRTMRPWDADSSWILREFADTLHRAAPEAQLLVVAMPLPRGPWTEQAWRELSSMAQQARAAVAGRAYATVANAIGVVPDSAFCTPTHMRPEGHELFADWLATRLLAPEVQAEP